MTPRTPLSLKLYDKMVQMGYPAEFAEIVTLNLNTDWTAKRMMGYLGKYKKLLPLEMVADEMLAILDDRNRIMQKKEVENTNALWNDFLNNGFSEDE